MTAARSKLHGVLQNLVEQKEDTFVNVEDDFGSPPQIVSTRKTSSPRKMVVRFGRKKKRKDDGKSVHSSHLQHRYVMKLFDRSVDLAQFDEDAPLYPICRAWMRNQPMQRDGLTHHSIAGLGAVRAPVVSDDSSDDEWDDSIPMEDDKPRDVKRLPPPLPLDPHDPRCPEPLPLPDQPLNIYKTTVIAPEELLLGHMARWKEMRQRWRRHAHENEERYVQSLSVLRTMYDRQMKDV